MIKRKHKLKPRKTTLKSRRKRLKKESVQYLKKQLDQVFSRFIRQRDKGVCFTCGDTRPWEQQQNGHYVSRGFNSLRFDERNCHCQCVGCNIFRHGNMDVYALRLTEVYGHTILKELNDEKKKITQFSPQQLKEMIQKYENLLK